ncbi:TauD/TfdA family dioxygenase [Falsiroseomonas selenitidurans]|uniref:TauD/TfdA family dioxygenase n=1 Tax=Falsiroseomonas selenitidurans TaxID=2716335 RepID=A0ABX1E0K3_9PROT|nr:TauD/TfdA family dioxygenase [Falsiroseomonas selenitidurans]NKC30692.1 TauD/TfdA family dioxygenase [Falsiroseomonas selenitidurans]
MSDKPPPSSAPSPALVAPRPRLVPQAGPAAWRATDLRPSDWMIPVGAEDAAELEQALAALGGRPPESAAEAPLPRLGAVLRNAATRLDTGRGFVLLRGLALGRSDANLAEEALLMALGVHLGRPLPGAEGAVQRLTSQAGGKLRWRFHADAADVVALLVLRQPPDVDPAMLVAAATVHNEMMKRDRAALEILHRPLPHLTPDGQVRDLPVFSSASGAFVGRYARDAIEAAQRLPETPRLTGAQVQALDLLDSLCAEPGLALRMEVRPGDVLLFNPLQVWKRRAEGVAEPPAEALPGDPVPPTPEARDSLVEAEPAPPAPAAPTPAAGMRVALRLLLLTETSRALPQGLLALGEGPAAAGNGAAMVGG